MHRSLLTIASCFLLTSSGFLCAEPDPASASPDAPAEVKVPKTKMTLQKPEDLPQEIKERAATEEKADQIAQTQPKTEEPKRALKVPEDPVRVYGWKEWIYIGKKRYKVKAKLDTGARTSSIHAEEATLFERDGHKWVKFIIVDPDEVTDKGRLIVEARLVRVARVKSSNGEAEERFVVELNFAIGDQTRREEFTLSDRSDLIHPVLLGRSAIQTLGWVDAGQKHIADDKIER